MVIFRCCGFSSFLRPTHDFVPTVASSYFEMTKTTAAKYHHFVNKAWFCKLDLWFNFTRGLKITIILILYIILLPEVVLVIGQSHFEKRTVKLKMLSQKFQNCIVPSRKENRSYRVTHIQCARTRGIQFILVCRHRRAPQWLEITMHSIGQHFEQE